MAAAAADSQASKKAGEALVRATGNRRVVESPSFVSYYANDTQLQTSPWDVRFVFGVIDDIDNSNNVVTVKRVTEVRMSPQHAKKLASILAKQLQNYEARMGTIPQPPEAADSPSEEE